MGEFNRYAKVLGLDVVPAVIRNVEFQTAVPHTWLGGFAKNAARDSLIRTERKVLVHEKNLLDVASVVVVVVDAINK
jgi:hypothetical protein